MNKYDDLAKAALYAQSKDGLASIWLEIIEDGIRVRGALKGMRAEKQVAWGDLEHYRNGAPALLGKVIDEVSDMLDAARPTDEMQR